MGGAEPGNGNWSPVEECLPAGAGVSGVSVEPAEGEAGGSPGNGKRSEGEDSFVAGVGAQVAGDDLSCFLPWSPAGAAVAAGSVIEEVEEAGQVGGETAGFCACTARAALMTRRIDHRIAIAILDTSFDRLAAF
jgi:hypothetical protein